MSDFRRIVTNAGWNLVGNLLPLSAALIAVPFLLQRIGTERFGLLSLVWVLIGYFSLFDLGLGRALTKMVAELAGGSRDEELSSLCSTGVAMVGVLGVVGGMLTAATIPWSYLWLDRLPAALRDEARTTLFWIALGIPLVVETAAMRGILEGFQRFKLLNAIRAPAGMLLFLSPCVSAWFSPRLDLAVAALLATRLLVLVAHVLPCLSVVRLSAVQVRRQWVAPLLRFGGWLTVSNVIAPVIVYIDRFVVGALLSAAALAYYSAPFEVVSRLLLLPIALTGALFPALIRSQVSEPHSGQALRQRTLKLTLAVVLPVAVMGAVFAEPGMRVWLGPEFAAKSAPVMQMLLLGFVLNSVAQIPFAALQGYGCTRQTAFVHLAELPAYIVVLLALVQAHGLVGAAIAWSLRALVDLVALAALLQSVERRLKIGQQPPFPIPSNKDARLHNQA